MEPEVALEEAGFWPDGWPIRLFLVEANDSVARDFIFSGKGKCRANVLSFVEEIPVEKPIYRLSRMWFERDYYAEMSAQQLEWHKALKRPLRDAVAVERGLRYALANRGLDWQLKRFASTEGLLAEWSAATDWSQYRAWVDKEIGNATDDKQEAAYSVAYLTSWHRWAIGASDAENAWDYRTYRSIYLTPSPVNGNRGAHARLPAR